jgi:hypothetical protein
MRVACARLTAAAAAMAAGGQGFLGTLSLFKSYWNQLGKS